MPPEATADAQGGPPAADGGEETQDQADAVGDTLVTLAERAEPAELLPSNAVDPDPVAAGLEYNKADDFGCADERNIEANKGPLATRAVPATTKDKVTRFLRLAARFEAGMVLLRRGTHDEVQEQLLMAPEGRHDGLVDALEVAVSAEWGLYMPVPSTYVDAVLDLSDARHFRPRFTDAGEPWIPGSTRSNC